MSTDQNIREAHASVRGYDYQKIKVLKLLLENLHDEDACATIEYIDDVYLEKRVAQGEVGKDLHQIKDYEGANSSLSFNNKNIQNSIANFLETWLQQRKSKNLKFCLCITSSIAKENMTKTLADLKIKLPKEPILQLIKERNFNDIIPILSEVMKTIFTPESNRKQWAEDVKNMLIGEWKHFLSQILIEDCSVIYDQLINDVVNILKQHEYLRPDYNIATESLFEKLVGFINLRLGKQDATARMIRTNDIKLKIVEEVKNINKGIDPSGDLLLNTNDTRNLKEKIVAVCANYKKKNILILERRSSIFMLEANKLANDPTFRAMKIRVYDICDQHIATFISNSGDRAMSDNEIESLLETLKNEAAKHLTELSVDYAYPLNNKISIEGLVLNLFDSCFLAFDEA